MTQLLLQFSHTTGIYWFMNTPWGWPIAESLHFAGLSLLIGTVGIFDLRLLGVGRGIDYGGLHRLVPYGVGGYLMNVATGIMFVSSDPDQYIYNPAFQTKLAFMLVAGLNMLWFYASSNRAVKATAADAVVTRRAKLIAGISLLCWCSIIICGRLITYYRPPYHWCLWC